MLIPLLDIYESLTEPFCSSCVLNSVRWEVFFVVDCEIHCGSSDDRDFSFFFFCEFGNEKIMFNAVLNTKLLVKLFDLVWFLLFLII